MILAGRPVAEAIEQEIQQKIAELKAKNIQPFLADILMAAILATIFYRPFEWLAKKLGNRKKLLR